MTDDFDPDAALRLVQTSFGAWMARDTAGMRACMSPDFIQWHNHIGRDFTLQEHQAMLQVVLAAGRLDYHDVDYLPIQGGVLVRCLCDVRMNDGGESNDVPFGMIFFVRNGLIYRCDEYMDGAALPPMNLGI